MKAAPAVTAHARAPFRYRVRWSILAYLFGFAFMIYMQRTSFSVAAVQMMPELGISQIQLGWLMTAYLVTYTAGQLPGGVFGQWLGSRAGLVIAGLVGLGATLATPLAPLLLGGSALIVVLVLSRLLVGAAHAPVFPISTGMIERWFPVGRWGCPTGLQTAGLHLGSAAATPLIAFLMESYGWKHALVWTSLPALLLIGAWAWYARERPSDHPSVSPAELAEVGDAGARAAPRVNMRDLLRVLANRDILMLFASYTIMNYVFYLLGSWSFLYLVQERHLSITESGVLGSFLFIAAAIGSAAGGPLSDWLALRYGLRNGYRAIPLVALPLAGVLLFVGTRCGNAYAAVAAFSLAYAALEITEAPFGAATCAIGREQTMAAWGVVGTGGNLGGIIGTPIVAWLSATGAWTAAFLTGTVAGVVSGILWLWVDGSRPIAPAPAGASGPDGRHA